MGHITSATVGTPTTHFSVLFADTVRKHGAAWAEQFYVRKHKMPAWEFAFWLRATS